MTKNERKRTQRHNSEGVEIQLWGLRRSERSPGCLRCHYDKWIQPSVRRRGRVMRSLSANNSLQTCRWRICRFELSSTLTGADSGRARRGASVTEKNVTWPFERRASDRTKCQRGHRLLWGTPHAGLSSWFLPNNTFAFRKLFFLLSFHPSLAPPFPPPRLPNGGVSPEELERGGSNGVRGDRLQTRSCRLSSGGGGLSV